MYVSIHAKHSIKTQKWKLANYFSGNPLKQLPTHVLGDKATMHKTAVLDCPIIAREAKTPSRGGFYPHPISSFNSAIKGGVNFHFSNSLPSSVQTSKPKSSLALTPIQSLPLLTNHIHAENMIFPSFSNGELKHTISFYFIFLKIYYKIPRSTSSLFEKNNLFL